MKFKKIIYSTLLVSVMAACNKDFEPLLNSPNQPTPETADVDLYLNSVQLNFNGFFQNVSNIGGQLTRQRLGAWNGPLFINAYSSTDFDGMWTTAYTGIIKNTDALVPLAQTQKKFVQSGIARALKAYTIGTLVDVFGNVPVTQANLGVANSNPSVDQGSVGYAAVQTLLDSAIADFAKPGAGANPTNDLYYAGSKANWTSFCKTLKLKFFLQARLVDNTVGPKIQTLLTENNFINASSQDFVFKYGISQSAPDSRHPRYSANYVPTGGPGDYMCNYYMWMVAAQKYAGTVNFAGDPRLRYYFYRQRTSYADATDQSLPCTVAANQPSWYAATPTLATYCAIGRGYWGRDFGDASGTPPDGNFRSTWGIYPVGGRFDDSQGAVVTLVTGGQGAGISPIWLASFTNFLKAEAVLALSLNAGATDAALLASGVSTSIAKVMAFPASLGVANGTNTPLAAQVTNYQTLVANNYAAATTTAAKLNILMTEYYLAAWGNGLETYNNYRRTGCPNNMQVPVAVATPGLFIRSFTYPSVFVNLNINAPAQKTPGVAANKVFWDNNPDNFIK